MARPRKFDQSEVVSVAKTLFAAQGYHGTSIDDLVSATGLLRGSLYKAFGSKRNLFELALDQTIKDFETTSNNIDLLTVALKELAPSDSKIRARCRTLVAADLEVYSRLLGDNLLNKMKES